MEEGNPQGGGWSYGWAAVALLLVFCGTLMVTIVEIYFVGGGWRHHTHEEHDEIMLPVELPTKVLNSSWMDEEFSIDASPLRKPGRLHALSSSALQFIGSPARIHGGTKSLLASTDSRDGEDTASGDKDIDLLGIDDDGSLLFPSKSGPQEVGTHRLVSVDSMDVRESSVFDDPYDGQYNNGPYNSFES